MSIQTFNSKLDATSTMNYLLNAKQENWIIKDLEKVCQKKVMNRKKWTGIAFHSLSFDALFATKWQ